MRLYSSTAVVKSFRHHLDKKESCRNKVSLVPCASLLQCSRIAVLLLALRVCHQWDKEGFLQDVAAPHHLRHVDPTQVQLLCLSFSGNL
jgi:hypothetical protein